MPFIDYPSPSPSGSYGGYTPQPDPEPSPTPVSRPEDNDYGVGHSLRDNLLACKDSIQGAFSALHQGRNDDPDSRRNNAVYDIDRAITQLLTCVTPSELKAIENMSGSESANRIETVMAQSYSELAQARQVLNGGLAQSRERHSNDMPEHDYVAQALRNATSNIEQALDHSYEGEYT